MTTPQRLSWRIVLGASADGTFTLPPQLGFAVAWPAPTLLGVAGTEYRGAGDRMVAQLWEMGSPSAGKVACAVAVPVDVNDPTEANSIWDAAVVALTSAGLILASWHGLDALQADNGANANLVRSAWPSRWRAYAPGDYQGTYPNITVTGPTGPIQMPVI